MANTQEQPDLEGKVAIVTGAASGIGRATALLFAARGAQVIGEDINPAVNELNNERIMPFVGDVASEDAAKRIVSLAVERFGKLDILVNNAATIKYTSVLDLTLEEWNHTLSVNLTGAFLHSREAVRAMIPNRKGAIVNMGSYACFFGFPQIGAYAASKGAVVTLTKSLALEAAGEGVRVVSIAPVATDTPMLPAFMGKRAVDDESRARYVATVPLGRLNQPEDLARTAVFLASDDAAMITGTCVEVDGGRCI